MLVTVGRIASARQRKHWKWLEIVISVVPSGLPVEGERMKRGFVVSALLTLAAVVVLPGIASASPTSGTEHFQIETVNNNPGGVLARGVFTASGTDYQKHGNSDLFVFSDGAFTVRHPHGTGTFTVNPKTCLLKGVFTGAYTINGGVGRYEGISGSGTYKGVETAVFPRNPNGTCNERGQPSSYLQKVTASGPISFKP